MILSFKNYLSNNVDFDNLGQINRICEKKLLS